ADLERSGRILDRGDCGRFRLECEYREGKAFPGTAPCGKPGQDAQELKQGRPGGQEAGMWDMLKENDECRKFRDGLEQAAARLKDAVRIESLIALLPEAQRGHLAACAGCREAANDLVQWKTLFDGAASFGEEERPWFPTRVMAAIASREKELAERVS